VRREDARADRFHRIELLFEVWRIRGCCRLRRRQAELGVIGGDRIQRRPLRRGIDVLGLRHDEEVDAERRSRLLAHPGGLPLHVRGVRVGEAERAERAGRAAGGDELLRRRPAGHWRLNKRQTKTELLAQGRCDFHPVSVKSSRPISQRRISDVPAPIS
jgi:hypothetical protein